MYLAYFILVEHSPIRDFITEEQRVDIVKQLNDNGVAYYEVRKEVYKIKEMHVIKLERII